MTTVALSCWALATSLLSQSADPAAPPMNPPALLQQASDGAVFMAGRRLTPREVYAVAGRRDLVERSDQALRRRWIFGISAALVTPAMLVGAVIARSRRPVLTSPDCGEVGVDPTGIPRIDARRFNTVCMPLDATLNAVSTGLLVGGLTVGAVLGSLAAWSTPDLLSSRATRALISNYNHEQLVTAPPRPQVQVVPVIGPGHWALTASGHF